MVNCIMYTDIIIGDNSIEFGQICVNILHQSGFTATTTEKDGSLLLKQIDKERPNIVIMDAFMKNLNAIGVMKYLNRQNYVKKPAFIVTSSFENKYLEDEIMKQGAIYYILKPFDLSILADQVKNLTGYLKSDNTDSLAASQKLYQKATSHVALVTQILRTLPMTTKLKGYLYVKEAILYVLSDKSLINRVTKELYPTIAKKHNTTSGAVERAIRNAIEITWDFGNIKMMNTLFGYDNKGGHGKPTNAKFISEIAEYINMISLKDELS